MKGLVFGVLVDWMFQILPQGFPCILCVWDTGKT